MSPMWVWELLVSVWKMLVPPLPRKKGVEPYANTLKNRFTASHASTPEEQAAEYAQRSIDLQVTKAGGLLAFNGLIVAVSTILWTNRVPPISWLPTFVFAVLFFSSVFGLMSIYVAWGRKEYYETADKDLQNVLRLGALRAWGLNISIVLSISSVFAIAWWNLRGTDKPLTVQVVGSAPLDAKSPSSVVVTNYAVPEHHCHPERSKGKAKPRRRAVPKSSRSPGVRR